MFHRLHKSGTKPLGQGSISDDMFRKIIHKIGPKNIVSPLEWMDIKKSEDITQSKFCFTFDDGLKSQYEIASPILEEFNIKAFYFIYTKTFSCSYDKNEIANYLITNQYESIEIFLNIFKNYLNKFNLKINKSKFEQYKKKMLSSFPFYSHDDLEYRYIRNSLLTLKQFDMIVEEIIHKENLTIENIAKELWMNENDVKGLANKGHEIGLHSHTHPFSIETFSKEEQYKEYNKNFNMIKNITGIKPKSMSHPLNSSNKDTIEILKKLKISCGFSSKVNHNYNCNNEEDRMFNYSRLDACMIAPSIS